MKSIWKWILGIAVVLVVVASLVGLTFVMHKRMSVRIVQKMVPHSQKWNGPAAPDGAPRRIIPPGMGPRMEMRGFGHGFGPGRMFFGMLGQLLPIAVLLLLLYGAYRLGQGKAPVAVAAAPPTPEPLPAATPTHPCAKCENPVQEDWKHCPNCGEEQ